MSAHTEFSKAWDRLRDQELGAITLCLTRMEHYGRKLAKTLAEMLIAESHLRQHMKTRPNPRIDWDGFTNIDVCDAYTLVLGLERALSGGSAVIQEWASLLRQTICSEMVSRLRVTTTLDEALKGN